MNKQQLQVIERALASDQELFPLNQTWTAIHQDYNIGLTQANKLKLSVQDKSELRQLVKHKTGISLNHHNMSDFSDLTREESLALAINEKLAGQAVKANRLALRTIADKPLQINQKTYHLPDSGFLDIALDSIHSIEHGCVLVVENYRCFDGLANMSLNLAGPFHDPIVLYRGDNSYSENTLRLLLKRLNLPTLAMPDIDLQGLVIAQSLPNIAGLVAPPIYVLENLLNAPNKANKALYGQQLAGCQQTLAKHSCPTINQFWQLLKKHQAGIVQEHWLKGDIELVIHQLNTAKQ